MANSLRRTQREMTPDEELYHMIAQLDARIEELDAQREPVLEEERRIYLESTVRDLLRRGYSYDQLAEIIWPTGYARYSEIGIVNEIIRQRMSEMTPEQREAEKRIKNRFKTLELF